MIKQLGVKQAASRGATGKMKYVKLKVHFLLRSILIKGLIRCIPKGPRRSPIIHAMYFMRHKLVDTTLKSVIESKKVNQFLILGAGTDTSFWRLEMAKRPEIRVLFFVRFSF